MCYYIKVICRNLIFAGDFMNKNKAKKIATWIIVPLMAAIFILDIITVAIGNRYAKRFDIKEETFGGEYGDDRIHFLNTANSDCILLESNGKFALIDSGEGENNPRRKSQYRGYSQRVISYLKDVAADESGKVNLEFIMATHYHYDHSGSFDKIINDEDIIINKAYFKEYDPDIDYDYEVNEWGLLEIYNTIIKDLAERNIELIQDIPENLTLGDFDIELFNTVNYEESKGKGENAASIGAKVVKGDKSAFLAADITSKTGLEKKLGESVGHVDLLKAAHHGYFGSSSMYFLDCLTPDVAIIPNEQGKVYPNVKWNFTMHAKIPFYATFDYNGIIASFTDDGEIILTNNIHERAENK